MFFSYKHFRKLTAAVAAHVSAAVIAPASSLPDAADVGGHVENYLKTKFNIS